VSKTGTASILVFLESLSHNCDATITDAYMRSPAGAHAQSYTLCGLCSALEVMSRRAHTGWCGADQPGPAVAPPRPDHV
jgi:hypothetical protein